MKWKNRLIKLVIAALTPQVKESKSKTFPDRFLIVSTTGVGDTLWATPAIRNLRQSYPNSTIAVLTSEIGAEVVQLNKNIDELFVISRPFFLSLLRMLPTLRKREFDAVLVFHASQRIVLPFCALTQAKEIIGTLGINKDLDFLFTKVLPKKHEHEIQRRLELIKEVKARVIDDHLEMNLSKEDELIAKRFLERHKIAPHVPILGLHPGAKNTFKQWAPESFVEVGRRLSSHLGCHIIVSGDQEEASLVLKIASQIPGAIPLAGELSLGAFSALLKHLSLFITNDTGPMHLAFASKTPTVALFGPTHPTLCGPFHVKDVRVLSASPTCSPCLKKACNEPFCLLQIGPSEVYDAALKLFYAKVATKQEHLQLI